MAKHLDNEYRSIESAESSRTTGVCSAQTEASGAVSGVSAWYAVHCKPRHEKLAAQRLGSKGLDVFLPLIRRTRVHRARRVEAEIPLFSCYLFANTPPDQLDQVAWTQGVVRILGAGPGVYTPVPTDQIELIRTALATDLKLDPHPHLKEGQRVRVRFGPLAALEGILIRKNRNHHLVITISLIAKSASLTINADDVETL